ncbi:hypothetical protein G7Y89_g5013 [Cudoniella acicularis]|uniref:Uncharacterized protein n=1 Tax=Cudoniella acicularis TaxID=354080 RepID=A0A8H4RNA0_9HELO|nr:hypothetical protein G7Y89_g5013 [Cudoniella acicularis]
MSEEDSLEEVYAVLSRSFSEDQKILTEEERAELTHIVDEEDRARSIDFLKRKRDGIENDLSDDLRTAIRWYKLLKNEEPWAIGVQEGGSEDIRTDEDMTEIGSVNAQTELRQLAAGEGILSNNSNPEFGAGRENMILRTGKRLQTDALRLLKLVRYMLDQRGYLETKDVDWLVAYLESRVRLMKGDIGMETLLKEDYQDPSRTKKVYYSQVWESQLPSLLTVGSVGPVNFVEPRWSSQSREKEGVVRSPQISPQGTAVDSEMPDATATSKDTPCTSSKTLKQETSVSRQAAKLHGQVRELGQKVDENRTSLEATFAKTFETATKFLNQSDSSGANLASSLDTAATLLENNVSLHANLQAALLRLEEELKHRKVAEKQKAVLSEELRQERALREKLEQDDKAIIGNATVERAYRLRRRILEEEIREAKSEMEANELTGVMQQLEVERERIWLEFITGLRGLSDTELEEMKALWKKKVRGQLMAKDDFSLISERSPSCLYCDQDFCPGCGGSSAMEFGE